MSKRLFVLAMLVGGTYSLCETVLTRLKRVHRQWQARRYHRLKRITAAMDAFARDSWKNPSVQRWAENSLKRLESKMARLDHPSRP